MLLSIVFVCHVLISTTYGSKKCFNNDREQVQLHFATKTPYRVIANKDDTSITFEECEAPSKIWSIIRHGTRNPGKKFIRQVNTRLVDIQSNIINNDNVALCPSEIAAIRSWQPNSDESEAKFLALEGLDELIELAERTQNRFPTLLPNVHNSSVFKFKYTSTQRTQKSFEGFATGLFGRNHIKDITVDEPLHKDPILRFYKNCPRWKEEVDNNPAVLEESRLWSESSTVRKLVKKISKKLDYPSLTVSDVRLMYLTCAFETSWYRHSMSPWCALFDTKSVKILEFMEDLEYYWNDGYGYELTYSQACIAFKDMIDHFSLNASYPKATFYFTHSGTMLKILAFLGLYKEEYHLTHVDFEMNRKWKTSKIDAFGSNLMFIQYICNGEPYILTMHQERVVHIPGCPQNEPLCKLDLIKQIFKQRLDNCRFDEMCRLRYNS